MTPEGQVLKAVTDLLAAKNIFAIRLNSGAFKVGGRFIKAHSGGRGVADIVSFPTGRVAWLEIKSATGRQSPEQKTFQAKVMDIGHEYHVIRSADDVERVM